MKNHFTTEHITGTLKQGAVRSRIPRSHGDAAGKFFLHHLL